MLTSIAAISDRQTAGSAIPFRSTALNERFRETCVRRLDADRPPLRPQPAPRTGGAPAPAPEPLPEDAPAEDPAVSAIAEWHAARTAYRTERRAVEPLWKDVPEWVRNWRGVYAGSAERADGEAVPVLARTEETLHQWYDQKAREATSPEAVRRIEKRRRQALAELRLALAAEKGACRAAGLPFEPGLEEDYWMRFRQRIARAEAAVETTPARSAEGIEARCRHVARLIDDLSGGDEADALSRHVRSVIQQIARDIADMSNG